jgi:hypothetical protein
MVGKDLRVQLVWHAESHPMGQANRETLYMPWQGQNACIEIAKLKTHHSPPHPAGQIRPCKHCDVEE